MNNNSGINFIDLNNESNRKKIISELEKEDELKDIGKKELKFYLNTIIEKIDFVKEKLLKIIENNREIYKGENDISVDEIQEIGNEIINEITLSEDEEVNVDFIFYFLYHFLVNSNINIDGNPHYTGE